MIFHNQILLSTSLLSIFSVHTSTISTFMYIVHVLLLVKKKQENLHVMYVCVCVCVCLFQV